MLGTAWLPNSARYVTIPETERDAKPNEGRTTGRDSAFVI
jgi:hypothetical protein